MVHLKKYHGTFKCTIVHCKIPWYISNVLYVQKSEHAKTKKNIAATSSLNRSDEIMTWHLGDTLIVEVTLKATAKLPSVAETEATPESYVDDLLDWPPYKNILWCYWCMQMQFNNNDEQKTQIDNSVYITINVQSFIYTIVSKVSEPLRFCDLHIINIAIIFVLYWLNRYYIVYFYMSLIKCTSILFLYSVLLYDSYIVYF